MTDVETETKLEPEGGDNRASAYLEGDVAVYRASAVGRCLKELVAGRLGFTPMNPPQSFAQRFSDGHLHEGDILKRLQNQHQWEVERASQREVELQVTPSIVIRGHIDGLGTRGILGRRLIEIKALSQRSYEEWVKQGWRWSLGQKYADQLTVYMKCLEDEISGAVMVVKNKNSGDLIITQVDEPPGDIDRVVMKVMQAEGWARKGELPKCDSVSYPCPFYYLHDEEEKKEAPAVDPDSAAEILALAETYDVARQRVDEAEAVRVAARERLLSVLGDTKKVDVEGWKVNNVTVNRQWLNKVSLGEWMAEHGKVLADFEEQRPQTQLRVRRPEKEEDEG